MKTDTLIKREQLAKKLCAELNNFVDLKHTLISIITDLKEVTGFEAISIRLHEDDDYPYYVYKGFPSSFIKQENFLCSHQSDSNANKSNKVECLCGNVIKGTINAIKPYYTAKGSYWTNNSTEVASELIESETSTVIRNQCNEAGYESIGLFPIKTRKENIGLIQLNDKKPGMFTEDTIEFLEMIGEQIGVAIENSLLYEKVKDKNAELQNTLTELGNMQNQLMEAKKMTALADLVSGIAHEIYQPISESLYLMEKVMAKTNKDDKSDNAKEIETNQQEIYNLLSNTKGLVKSFRSIAFDQFQESRHLINISNFLNDIIRAIRPSLKKKDIEFVVECDLASEIMSFTGILSQVIAILIQNAYAHAFENQSNCVISLGCSIKDEEIIELTVSDNGVGIAQDIQHKLFEPFFSTKKKGHTGLGLHTAKNLIENKLKGKIILDLEHSKGSKFVIQIPT